jgi:hypothetical protein
MCSLAFGSTSGRARKAMHLRLRSHPANLRRARSPGLVECVATRIVIPVLSHRLERSNFGEGGVKPPRGRPRIRPQARNRGGVSWKIKQLRKWTRSQPIRTAAQVPLRFSLLELSNPFPYQSIAERALRLRRLGMSDSSIARSLGVNDKTVAKSIRWILSTHSGANPGRPETR